METEPLTDDAPVTIEAIARWLELGPTSGSNPVYRFAAARFLQPIGVAVERLQFDLLTSNLVVTKPWLFRPTFDPGRAQLTEETELAKALRILNENRRLFESEVSLFGDVSIRVKEGNVPNDLLTTQIVKAVGEAALVLKKESAGAYARLRLYLEALGPILSGTGPNELELQRLLVARSDTAFCEGVLRRAFDSTQAPV